MSKLFALFINTSKNKNANKHDDYEQFIFNNIIVSDGKTKTSYTQLSEIGFLFNKDVRLIAFNGYFHFGYLQHLITKQGLSYDFDQCYTLCCVTDLCNLLNHPIPELSLNGAIKIYKKLLPKMNNNVVLKHQDAFWFTHGGERVITNQSGKWIIFGKKLLLHDIWELIVTNQDKLGYNHARVSTISVNVWGGKPSRGVIELFYENSNEATGKSIINLCREQLLNASTKYIVYKTDEQTKMKIKNPLIKLNVN